MGADRRVTTSLDQAGSYLNPVRDVSWDLEPILDILEQSFSAQEVVIWLRNGTTNRMVALASRGVSDKIPISADNHECGILKRILDHAEVILVPDVSKEPLSQRCLLGNRHGRLGGAFVGTPIVLAGMPIGALCAYFAPEQRASVEEHLTTLQRVASVVSGTIGLHRRLVRTEAALAALRVAAQIGAQKRIGNFLSQAKSARMSEVVRLVKEAASKPSPVLIQGELGTGKALAGRAIHELSGNRHPLIRIGCTVSDTDLLKTLSSCRGLRLGDVSTVSESGVRGTLLFARIDAAREAVQRKILKIFTELRACQEEGKLEGPGVRIIATSESELSRAVENGSFNRELYRALSSVVIDIPPLRERREDLLGLVNFFSTVMQGELGESLRFSPRAVRVLHRYSWPGNVRELENLIERMAITVRDREVDADDLSPYAAALLSRAGSSENGTLDSLQLMEKRSVVSALERNLWVQSSAARELGITMRQMGYRIKKYDLSEMVRQNRDRNRSRR